MQFLYHHLFQSVWAAFCAYWIISALRVKRIRQPEPAFLRLNHMVWTLFSFALVASDWFRFGPLGWPLLPRCQATFVLGAGILVASLGFVVWARLHLGSNWSGSVALKEGHRLVRSGPYRLVRHPIYTGLIGGLAGTAIAVGELRGVIAIVLLTATFWFKCQREERLMVSEFGDEYVQYRKEVKALIPFIF